MLHLLTIRFNQWRFLLIQVRFELFHVLYANLLLARLIHDLFLIVFTLNKITPAKLIDENTPYLTYYRCKKKNQ